MATSIRNDNFYFDDDIMNKKLYALLVNPNSLGGFCKPHLKRLFKYNSGSSVEVHTRIWQTHDKSDLKKIEIIKLYIIIICAADEPTKWSVLYTIAGY